MMGMYLSKVNGGVLDGGLRDGDVLFNQSESSIARRCT